MIITIDKPKFYNLMKEDFLELPIRWDGRDFYRTVFDLYYYYTDLLEYYIDRRELNSVTS